MSEKRAKRLVVELEDVLDELDDDAAKTAKTAKAAIDRALAAFAKRDVRIIAEVKDLLDQLSIDKRDPVMRKAYLNELIAEAVTRLEGLP